jgi:hypothetical protein
LICETLLSAIEYGDDVGVIEAEHRVRLVALQATLQPLSLLTLPALKHQANVLSDEVARHPG